MKPIPWGITILLTTLYVGGSLGDDDNDGYDSQMPLASIERALELIGGMDNPKIVLVGNLDSSYTLDTSKLDTTANIDGGSFVSIKGFSGPKLTILGNNKTIDAAGKNKRGLYIDYNGILSIEDLTIEEGDTSASGGGIYFQGTGELILGDGMVIQNNKAQQNGGGIALANNTRLYINDVTMEGNAAVMSGGGLYIDNAEAVMRNGTIGSSGKPNSSNYGGSGVHVNGSAAVFEMNESLGIPVIEYNHVRVTGEYGGVLVNGGGTFRMNGGVIRLNTNVGTVSRGVYTGTGSAFTMGGSAQVDQDNVVFLSSGTKIALTGAFTGSGYIAKILPETPSSGTTVIDASVFGGAMTQALANRFTLAATGFTIDLNGKLTPDLLPSVVLSPGDDIQDAIDSLAAGTRASPSIITLTDGTYSITDTDVITLSGKHIAINVPAGDNATLQVVSSLSRNVISVSNDSSLYLGQATGGGTLTIDGGNGSGIENDSSLIGISGTSYVEMFDGVTLKNNVKSGTNAEGGAVIISGSTNGTTTFKMSGGEISDNEAAYGGGILINDGGRIFLEKGEIKDNYARVWGGGIASWNGGINQEENYPSINISGTVEIHQNQAADQGGGVFSIAKTEISGGLIYNNSAISGGGIYKYTATYSTVDFIGSWTSYVYSNTGGDLNWTP